MLRSIACNDAWPRRCVATQRPRVELARQRLSDMIEIDKAFQAGIDSWLHRLLGQESFTARRGTSVSPTRPMIPARSIRYINQITSSMHPEKSSPLPRILARGIHCINQLPCPADGWAGDGRKHETRPLVPRYLHGVCRDQTGYGEFVRMNHKTCAGYPRKGYLHGVYINELTTINKLTKHYIGKLS